MTIAIKVGFVDEEQEINCSRATFKAVSRDDRWFGLPCPSIVVSSEYSKQGNWIFCWRSADLVRCVSAYKVTISMRFTRARLLMQL